MTAPTTRTGPTATRLKITYATLRNDNEELHAAFEEGIARARAWLGGEHRNHVAGRPRDGDGAFEDRSPVDGSLLGTFARGTRRDGEDAIAAAREAFVDWGHRPWQERVTVLRRAADLISERQMELAALMVVEVGKNRLEALGDVEETADLIRYYCDQMDSHEGFDTPMGNLGDSTVHTRSDLGKNRLEARGDVEETADLIRYYCDQMDSHEGFDTPMGNLGDSTVHTRS